MSIVGFEEIEELLDLAFWFVLPVSMPGHGGGADFLCRSGKAPICDAIFRVSLFASPPWKPACPWHGRPG